MGGSCHVRKNVLCRMQIVHMWHDVRPCRHRQPANWCFAMFIHIDVRMYLCAAVDVYINDNIIYVFVMCLFCQMHQWHVFLPYKSMTFFYWHMFLWSVTRLFCHMRLCHVSFAICVCGTFLLPCVFVICYASHLPYASVPRLFVNHSSEN